MIIERVYNNNVVQVRDQDQEMVVMGKGLGFQKKAGDTVAKDQIEKRFILEKSHEENQRVSELSRVFQDLSSQELSVILAIIDHGQAVLDQTFDMTLYISLADHLHYAIQRTKEGLAIENPLAWEVRKFYPSFYQIGERALEMIAEDLEVTMAKGEAASIALHFINAQKEDHLLQVNQEATEIVVNCLEIVRLHFGHLAPEDSISYNRFMTHLQYYAQRVISGSVQGSNDDFLYEQVQVNYQAAFACTQKIKAFIESHYPFEMSKDEQVYLTIHIQRQHSQE